jgi:hypothetical protein
MYRLPCDRCKGLTLFDRGITVSDPNNDCYFICNDCMPQLAEELESDGWELWRPFFDQRLDRVANLFTIPKLERIETANETFYALFEIY